MQPAIRRSANETSIVVPIMAWLSFASLQQLCHPSKAYNLPATAEKFILVAVFFI